MSLRHWLASALLGACALSAVPAGCLAAGIDPLVGADGLLKVPPLARVVDQPGQLADADRASLQERLQRFESERGAQVAIVIVASTLGEPIEDFGHRVGDSWKIGRRGAGDGLLILVATQDRRARIEVARALEGAIPDAIAKRVVQQAMGPHFKAGDYAGGLSTALDILLPRIEQEQLGGPMPPVPGPPPAAPPAPGLQNLLPLLFGAVFIGMALRRALGAGGALAGLAVFVIAMLLGAGYGRSIGGPGGIGFPGSWGGGGGFGSGGGGGGFSSGGGGDFSGGGASGDW